MKISYSLTAILFSIILFTSVASVSADIIPPKKQAHLGISNEDITCESGYFKVTKQTTNSVACVKPTTVSKLVSIGWAKQIDGNLLDYYIDLDKKSVGTIKVISVTPVPANVGKLKTETPTVGYDYVFEVCASSKKIYSPDVLIRSDSDTKHYELAETINAEQCVLSVTRIKAADPDSIHASLLNKGDLSNTIGELESRIDTLKGELAKTRSSLGKAPIEGQEKTKQGNKIADLRKQINDARADLHRLYFTMYTTTSKTTALEKLSFTGTPIEGETATKLSVTKSLAITSSGESQYDVTFEACAGQKLVRLPTVLVTSDRTSTAVKMGDKISPNSCQMSFTKIVANDPKSIMIETTGNPSTDRASELEETIVALQQKLTAEKQKLRDLTHNPNRPLDFTTQVDAFTSSITMIREQLISAKAEFSGILFQTYR